MSAKGARARNAAWLAASLVLSGLAAWFGAMCLRFGHGVEGVLIICCSVLLAILSAALGFLDRSGGFTVVAAAAGAPECETRAAVSLNGKHVSDGRVAVCAHGLVIEADGVPYELISYDRVNVGYEKGSNEVALSVTRLGHVLLSCPTSIKARSVKEAISGHGAHELIGLAAPVAR